MARDVPACPSTAEPVGVVLVLMIVIRMVVGGRRRRWPARCGVASPRPADGRGFVVKMCSAARGTDGPCRSGIRCVVAHALGSVEHGFV